MSGGPQLVMVVPTYQEHDNVDPLIGQLDHVRARVALDVLIVDDASPDGTGARIRQLQTSRDWLHLLGREGRMGLGSAYRAGFGWAIDRDYGYIGEMDADLSHDPARIPALLGAALSGADLALGSRYVHGGGSLGWPLHRRILSRGGNAFARGLLALRVHDVTGGFRVYTRRAVQQILAAGTECDGYGFQIEGVATLARSGMTIEEVPIVFRERRFGSSKMDRAIVVEAVRRCLELAFDRPPQSGDASLAGSRFRTATPDLTGDRVAVSSGLPTNVNEGGPRNPEAVDR